MREAATAAGGDALSWIVNPVIGNLGAGGLVVIIVIMVLTGRLVPKSSADTWREAYFKERQANAIKDESIAKFADASVVTARALDALPAPDGGDSDVEETTQTRRRRQQG